MWGHTPRARPISFGSPGLVVARGIAQWAEHGAHNPDRVGSNPTPASKEKTVAEDLANTIKRNAEGPAEAHDEAGGMKQHSLPDQIAADKYLANKSALKSRGLGLKKVRIIPPGSV